MRVFPGSASREGRCPAFPQVGPSSRDAGLNALGCSRERKPSGPASCSLNLREVSYQRSGLLWYVETCSPVFLRCTDKCQLTLHLKQNSATCIQIAVGGPICMSQFYTKACRFQLIRGQSGGQRKKVTLQKVVIGLGPLAPQYWHIPC